MTLRFWVQSDTMRGWRQLLELSLNLNSLQYLGRSVCYGGATTRADHMTDISSYSLTSLPMPCLTTPSSFTFQMACTPRSLLCPTIYHHLWELWRGP